MSVKYWPQTPHNLAVAKRRRINNNIARLLTRPAPAPTTKTLNKKIKRINKRIELKHIDANINGSAVTDTGLLISNHMLVRLGDTNITRTGNWIHPTSLVLNFRISSTAASVTTDVIVRMIVFWDRQANGSAPALLTSGTSVAPGALLDNSVINGSDSGSPYAPRNTDSMQHFKILMDRTFVLKANQVATVTTGATDTTATIIRPYKVVRRRIRLNRDVQYQSDDGDLGDVVGNAVYVAFFSDSDTAAAVTGGVRMFFKDA